MARLVDVHTVDQLTALIDSINVEVASGRTILYSGHLGLSRELGSTAIKSRDVAALLAANHPQLQIIDELPIGKFLETQLGSIEPNYLLIDKLNQLFDKDLKVIVLKDDGIVLRNRRPDIRLGQLGSNVEMVVIPEHFHARSPGRAWLDIPFDIAKVFRPRRVFPKFLGEITIDGRSDGGTRAEIAFWMRDAHG